MQTAGGVAARLPASSHALRERAVAAVRAGETEASGRGPGRWGGLCGEEGASALARAGAWGTGRAGRAAHAPPGGAARLHQCSAPPCRPMRGGRCGAARAPPAGQGRSPHRCGVPGRWRPGLSASPLTPGARGLLAKRGRPKGKASRALLTPAGARRQGDSRRSRPCSVPLRKPAPRARPARRWRAQTRSLAAAGRPLGSRGPPLTPPAGVHSLQQAGEASI